MTFEVDTSSLDSTINSMESELENIVNITKRLYAALEALDATWEGEAHSTFARQYIEDSKTVSDMMERISDVIEGLDSARKKYDSCEQSVKNKISRIAI